jgi:hypothetical protein
MGHGPVSTRLARTMLDRSNVKTMNQRVGPVRIGPLVVLLVVAGCAAAPGAGSSVPASEAPAVVSQQPEASPMTTDVPAELLDEVLASAAERAGVEHSEVAVVVAESVTWSDGSLGCPVPGMADTQALVPGYRVVVEAGGDELHFHASERGDVRFCADPQPALEGNPND